MQMSVRHHVGIRVGGQDKHPKRTPSSISQHHLYLH